MKNNFLGRNFINANDWSKKDLELALKLAVFLKKKYSKESFPALLHKTLYLLFFFFSTRTRTSFEAAMDHLGGNSHELIPGQLQIHHGDTAKEIGNILSSYGHGIAIRQCDWGVGNKYINEVAKHSSVPVFNMQCDVYHPFQAMADLMTIREEFGINLKGKKIVMSWAYAKTYAKPVSVPQSFLLLLSLFGADLVLAHPKKFELMPDIISEVKNNIKKHGGNFLVTNNMEDAAEGAHVVYAKNWGALCTTNNQKKLADLAFENKDWICDEKLMKKASKKAIYMHCLPAERGVEVTDAVIDGLQSVVYRQAENRLHVQKAILLLTMVRHLDMKKFSITK